MRRGAPAPADVHRRLLAGYGPQGWWPVSPRAGGPPVYESGRARALREDERVEVCVGAILTQNTNWGNVVKALARLRRAAPRLSWRALAEMSSRRLESVVRPSGYFRQKTRKLKIFARAALTRDGGTGAWLASGSVARRREELLGLWGIGPETADSILLYAGERPSFVVDAYTRRIGERLGWWRNPSYDEARDFLVRRLPEDRGLYAESHALFVRLAKENCRVRPDCGACHLRAVCAFAARQGA